MDGTAKGGGAISAVSKTNARIMFIGTGEHIRDIEIFDANKFISRLLGMGDLSTLIELASEETSGTDAIESVNRAMMLGKFNLNDMYSQMVAVGKMGPLEKIMSLIPGMSGMEGKIDFEASQKKLKVFRTIMDSMTNEEKEHPSIIKTKRIDRIAYGAGVTTHDVRELLKQYNQSKKMMTSIGKNRKMRKKLMKQISETDIDNIRNLQ